MSRKAPALTDFRRIVVKVGSSLLVDSGGGRLKDDWLVSLAEDLAALHGDKRDVLVVSSGAIALGRAVLKLPKGPLKLEDSQAAAAVGQIALARTWAEVLGRHGITAGQVLVTLADTEERRRYLNARSTIDKLLEWRAVPVINENDTVATNEIRYGDNDRLAARVATMASADLLVLLSDVDGLYDAPPRRPRRQARAAGRAHHAGDRGDGGRRRLRAVARRHADQDRGRQDRHHRRHPHGDRLRARRHPLRRSPRARAAPGS
jgi:glutamate 5-kinase